MKLPRGVALTIRPCATPRAWAFEGPRVPRVPLKVSLKGFYKGSIRVLYYSEPQKVGTWCRRMGARIPIL